MKNLYEMMKQKMKGGQSSSSSSAEQELRSRDDFASGASYSLQVQIDTLRKQAYEIKNAADFTEIVALYAQKSLADGNLSQNALGVYINALGAGINNSTTFPTLEKKDVDAIAEFESQALIDTQLFLLQKAQNLQRGKIGIVGTMMALGHIEQHRHKMEYLGAAVKYLSNPSTDNHQAYNIKSEAFVEPESASAVRTLREEINKFEKAKDKVSQLGFEKFSGGAIQEISIDDYSNEDDDIHEIKASDFEDDEPKDGNKPFQ